MAVSFFGDFDTTETVVIPFNTFSSNDPSASVTITNLVNTDIHIHKDAGLTQRASSIGVTVSIDFDGITGNHACTIDLSDNSDAGFYADGSQYQVRMEGTTVDAGTINAWIGAFSIGRTLRPTTAGRTLDVTAGGTAGIDWANIESPSTVVDLSGTDINLVDTTTTNTDMRGTDNAALASVVGTLTDVAAAGDPTTVDTAMQYIKQLVNVLVGTDGITTFPAEAAPANNVSLAEVIRAIHADVTGLNGEAMRGTDSAFLAANAPTNFSDLSITATTGLVDVNDKTGFSLSNASISSSTFAADAIDAAALASDAVTEIRSLVNGTADSGSTTTMVDAARTEADTDYWKGKWILFTSGSIANQVRLITAFTPGTDTITFAPAATQAVSTNTYEILSGADVSLRQWLGTTPNALVSGRVDSRPGALASNVITATSINSGAITSAKFATDAITSTVIAANAIGSSEIAADAITAAKIANGAIDAATFAAGAIDAAAIANGAIDAATFAAGAIDAAAIANSAIDAATFAAGAIDASAIASAAITSAKFGSGAIDAAALATDAVNEIRDAILPTQNATFDNISFLFVDSTDHVTPVTGATGTSAERSIDGGAFASATGTLAEVANGIYQFDASAADMNGGIITFRFAATGGTPNAPDDRFVTIVTGGGV